MIRFNEKNLSFSTNLIRRKSMLSLFYHSVNCIRNAEGVWPIVIRNFAIVLSNRQNESDQRIEIESEKRKTMKIDLRDDLSTRPSAQRWIDFGQIEEHEENVSRFAFVVDAPWRKVESFDIRNNFRQRQRFEMFEFFVGARSVIGKNF